MISSKPIKKEENDGLLFKRLEEMLIKEPSINTVKKIIDKNAYQLMTFLTYTREQYENTKYQEEELITNFKKQLLDEYDSAVRLLNKCKEIAPEYAKEKFVKDCLPANVEKMIY